MSFVVLEAGSSAGATVAEWSHVRLFSPWSELDRPGRTSTPRGEGLERPGGHRLPDWRGLA